MTVQESQPTAVLGPLADDDPVEVRSDQIDEAIRQRPRRIVSLDVVRGLFLIVSVGVNSWPWWAMPAWFDHASWIGIHPLDLVFPAFVTLSGCGMAFANARGVRLRPILQRVVILFTVGLIYNWIEAGSPPFTWSNLRIPGVLQLYAFIVLIIGLAHYFLKGWKTWALVTVLLALADSALIGFWGLNCAGGQLTTVCNPSHSIDYWVFGSQHLYAAGMAGYDPEGLPSIFGALVAASIGVTIGHALLAGRQESDKRKTVVRGATIVASGLVLAYLLGKVIPAFKKQWTAPFTLLVSSVTAGFLVVAHLIVDRSHLTRWQERAQWPLVALGRNSLFVYFGSHCLTNVLITHPGPGTDIPALWFVHLEHRLAIFGHPQLSITVFLELVWLSLACLLHRFKIYLRP